MSQAEAARLTVVSGQLFALTTDLRDSLGRLNGLIENRGAWVDAIEGCREGAVMLGRAHERLKEILEEAETLEAGLASARAELVQWGKTHAESVAIEVALRADRDQYKTDLATARAESKRVSKRNTDLSAVERELRAECEQLRATRGRYDAAIVANGQLRAEMKKLQDALEKQNALLDRTRSFAHELTRELA